MLALMRLLYAEHLYAGRLYLIDSPLAVITSVCQYVTRTTVIKLSLNRRFHIVCAFATTQNNSETHNSKK